MRQRALQRWVVMMAASIVAGLSSRPVVSGDRGAVYRFQPSHVPRGVVRSSTRLLPAAAFSASASGSLMSVRSASVQACSSPGGTSTPQRPSSSNSVSQPTQLAGHDGCLHRECLQHHGRVVLVRRRGHTQDDSRVSPRRRTELDIFQAMKSVLKDRSCAWRATKWCSRALRRLEDGEMPKGCRD